MFGPHMAGTMTDWDKNLDQFPAGTPLLSVNDQHLLRDAKSKNPDLTTIFRHWWDNSQEPFSLDYNAMCEMFRRYVNSWLDNTFRDQELWRHMSAIKELNEYHGWTASPEETQRVLTWIRAATDTWNNEYRMKAPLGYADIPLVVGSWAVGNDVPEEAARIVYESDNWLSYHGYMRFNDGVRDPLDLQYHSGRWMWMDERFRAKGIYPTWVMTETGPYHGVYEGWRHAQCMNGDFSRFILEFLAPLIDQFTAWNRDNNHRFMGGVLFTTTGGGWHDYNLEPHHLDEIARFQRDYLPEPPDPPPPPPPDPDPEPPIELHERLYAAGVKEVVVGNDNALNLAIWDDGWDVAGFEKTIEDEEGTFVIQPATSRDHPDQIRTYAVRQYDWANVFWLNPQENSQNGSRLFEVWPTTSMRVTQWFGANPDYYRDLTNGWLPGHEGIDLESEYDSPYYAVLGGTVIHASKMRMNGNGESLYGYHVVVHHGSGLTTLYAHARPDLQVEVGDRVGAGEVLAYSGETGNAFGPHLHLTVKQEGYYLPGWPAGYMDPWPLMKHLEAG